MSRKFAVVHPSRKPHKRDGDQVLIDISETSDRKIEIPRVNPLPKHPPHHLASHSNPPSAFAETFPVTVASEDRSSTDTHADLQRVSSEPPPPTITHNRVANAAKESSFGTCKYTKSELQASHADPRMWDWLAKNSPPEDARIWEWMNKVPSFIVSQTGILPAILKYFLGPYSC